MAKNRRKQKYVIDVSKLSNNYEGDTLKYLGIPKEYRTDFNKHVKYTNPLVAKEIFIGNFLTAGDISHDIVKMYKGKKKHLSLRQANSLINGDKVKKSIPNEYLAKVHLLICEKPHYRYIKSGVYKREQTRFGRSKWQTVVAKTGYIKFINSIYQKNKDKKKMFKKLNKNSKYELILKIVKLKKNLSSIKSAIKDTKSDKKIYDYINRQHEYEYAIPKSHAPTPSMITNKYNDLPEPIKPMVAYINHADRDAPDE